VPLISNELLIHWSENWHVSNVGNAERYLH
jgi:hypothetical protein